MRKRNSAIISGFGIIALLLALAPVLHAQDENRSAAGPAYPGGSDIAFEWQYSWREGLLV
jgi:hypothetical protein